MGFDSIPRIEELLRIGMKIEAIADRFQVTRHTITRTLKKKPAARTSNGHTTLLGAESESTGESVAHKPQASQTEPQEVQHGT